MENDKIKVLRIKPEEVPEVVTIENNLKNLQKEVEGFIQIVYPFEEEVGIVCNEEGKINGLPLNRTIYNEEGQAIDIISGNMLIVGLGEEDFRDLSPEEIKKFGTMFRQPEIFWHNGNHIISESVNEEDVEV